jgi:hypothetical protein
MLDFYYCAFDLLKNKKLDKTISVVLCLILKLFLRMDKLGLRDQTKIETFVPH